MSEEQRGSPDPEEPQGADGFNRRTFVVSSTALGAAVVWGASFPFADAAIGQTITATAATSGTTGPTGTSGSTGNTSSTGSTSSTGTTTTTTTSSTTATTGSSGSSGPAPKPAPAPARAPAKVGALEIIVVSALREHKSGIVRANVRWTGPHALRAVAVLQAVIGAGRTRRRVDIGRTEITLESERLTIVDIALDKTGLELIAAHKTYPVRFLLSGAGATTRARMFTLHRATFSG
jgi:hypothetical protein